MTLRELLDKAYISQAELSDKMGVTSATVSRWLNGTRSPKRAHVRRMAEVFGVTIDEMRAILAATALPDAVEE
jgi:transcriptional regulator with XRE-family HTH domain